MTQAEITFGETADVRNFLSEALPEEIPYSFLVGALVNAMDRIHHLERRLREQEDSEQYQAELQERLKRARGQS